MRAPEGLPIPLEDYLSQTETYWSESGGRFEQIKFMPCPHALRALAKLERILTFEVLSTPLAEALKARAETGIGGEVTDVPAVQGESRMIRDKRSGRFRGGYRKSAPKPRRQS